MTVQTMSIVSCVFSNSTTHMLFNGSKGILSFCPDVSENWGLLYVHLPLIISISI